MLARAPALLARHRDLLLAAAIVLALAALLVPLPPAAMDYLLAANFAMAAALLIAAAGPGRAGMLPSLPAALLVASLLRLVLGIAAARLILLDGDAGRLIEGLGSAAAGGNAIVGAVIFAVLVVVQLIVVARGSERAAEVAARFTLDAMPGAQMSIDADVRAGTLGPAEARVRRAALQREARLHGAMDGAMKFVRGDAAAGVVLALATFLGGVAAGVTQQGMSVRDAAGVYALLTVGAGLALLIPSMMIGVGAALAATRVAGEAAGAPGWARAPGVARLTVANALIAAAAVLAAGTAGAALAGLPWTPLAVVTLVAAFVAGAWRLMELRARAAASRGMDGVGAFSPLSVDVHPMLHSSSERGRLNDRLQAVRLDVGSDLGLEFPAASVRTGGKATPPDGYVVSIHGAPVGRGAIAAGRLVALSSVAQVRAMGVEAAPTALPWGREGACVVAPAEAARIRDAGIRVLDPAEFVGEHLRHTLRHHAAEFMGIQETRAALDRLESTHPDLVRAVTPGALTLTQVAEVLQRLLREGVPVGNLPVILESMARWAPGAKSTAMLTERVRADLARMICARLSAGDGRLRHYTVDPEIEDALRDAAVESPRGPAPALSYGDHDRILNAFVRGVDPARSATANPVVVVSPAVRPLLHALLADAMPEVAVLSYEELAGANAPEPLGIVGFADEAVG